MGLIANQFILLMPNIGRVALQAALRNNLIDIHKCHQTNNQNTTGDLPILVQVKDEGVRLKENLAYSVSITSASNDNIAPSPYNFAVTSFFTF